MPTNGNPPPTWKIEKAILYVVAYYTTNAANAAPQFVDPVMYDINKATAKAQEYITNAGNVGVCTIQPVACNIVYPSIPWQDF